MQVGPTALPSIMAAELITPNPGHTELFWAACWPVGISHAGALGLRPPAWGVLPSPHLEPGVQPLRALLPAPFLLCTLPCSTSFLLCTLLALHPSCSAPFLSACHTSLWAGLAGCTPFPSLAWPFMWDKIANLGTGGAGHEQSPGWWHRQGCAWPHRQHSKGCMDKSHGAVGTPVSPGGVRAVPCCLEAGRHCTSSHRPRAEGDDLFLEMFAQFLSLQRGWGVCLRAGPPALPQCRGQWNGAPHLLSPASRGTSTPTASSPMTRGCSPCRWVQGVCSPCPGQDAALQGPGCSSPSPLRWQQPVVCFLHKLQDAGTLQPLQLGGGRGSALQSTAHPHAVPATQSQPHGARPCPLPCPLRVSLVPSSLQLSFLPPKKSVSTGRTPVC